MGWGERGTDAVGRLRATLSEVGEALKARLVAFLDQLEACGAEVGG